MKLYTSTNFLEKSCDKNNFLEKSCAKTTF